MGLSVFPAPSTGGVNVVFPNAGELVSSGTIGEKGFFLSDTLSAGDYIVVSDLREMANTSESSYMSVNAFNSGVWHPYEATNAANGTRVKITENDKIAVGPVWQKAGAEYFSYDTRGIYINGLGANWQPRSYFNNKFYNTNRYFQWWGDGNNSSSNRVSYHDFASMTTLDVPFIEYGSLANTDDANLGNARPHTSGGVVGNFAYFSFTANSAAQRIWRANLATPNTWTVGTTAAATDGFVTGIAYNGSTYVLITSTGVINTSPDFATWTKQTSPITSATDITFANGQFVIVGLNGMIATSPNGFTWTKRTAPAGVVHFYNVNYIGAQYIAIGGQVEYDASFPWYGVVNANHHAKSSDGITWTSFDLQPTKSGTLISSANRYASFQTVNRFNYENSTNRNYGANQSYVYNGYLYVDIAQDKKYVTSDGNTWHCLYQNWNNANIITTLTHGQLSIAPGVFNGERPGFYISAPPKDAKVFIYRETA